MFIIGLGFLTRSGDVIASQLNILAASLIIWSIDFVYLFTTHRSLWGITDYFFGQASSISSFVTLQHLYTLPITLIGLSYLGLKRKDFWRVSILQVTILFAVILLFTDPVNNINCVFESCFAGIAFDHYYFVVWFVAVFAMIFVTDRVLVSLFYKKS